ncbi:hypothetical protein Tco_0071949 [Tanacetum coccineum]
MVAFLSKPAESEGFEQIVDFLNAHRIKYALTVNPTIYTSCIEQFWATVKEKIVNGEEQFQALVDGKKIIISESIVRRDLQLEDAEGVSCLPNATIFKELTRMSAKTTAWNEFSSTIASAIICLATNQKFNFSKYIFESMVKNLDNAGKFLMYPSVPSDNIADEAVNEEIDTSLVRATTTVTGLDAKQNRGNINKTQSKATPNEPSSPGTSSCGGPKRQETIGDTISQTRLENVSKTSNDPLLVRVLALETTKITQANEITSLKRRVKRLKKKDRKRTHKGRRIHDIDADEDITLVNDQDDADMFGVNELDGDELVLPIIEKPSESITTTPTLTTTTAATKITAISTRPRAKGIVFHEQEQAPTLTVSSQQPSQVKVQDKGKGIMVEEPVKMKKKDQISLDEELAFKLQAKEDEEERLVREKAQQVEEANIA